VTRVTDATVRALRDKYREIKRLRDEDAAGLAVAPRAAMAELARRFPGALRELDELPMNEIERRLSAIEAVVAGRAAAPPWVSLQVGYHGWMRAVLRVKRIAAGRRATQAGEVLRELSACYVPEVDEPPLSAFDAAVLAKILEPEEGRLNPWVYGRVAEEHGVDPDTVRRALFVR
jgi:hypothetical protein